jgi:hypothetical protein
LFSPHSCVRSRRERRHRAAFGADERIAAGGSMVETSTAIVDTLKLAHNQVRKNHNFSLL